MERFEAKYIPCPTSGCWHWVGATNKQGYGLFTAPRKNGARGGGAHRWAYENLVAPIPDGMTIDHLCRIRCCVNPAHMEVVTIRENAHRGLDHNARKDRCPRGHAYEAGNILFYKTRTGVGRKCRICHSIRMHKKYRAKNPVVRRNRAAIWREQ